MQQSARQNYIDILHYYETEMERLQQLKNIFS